MLICCFSSTTPVCFYPETFTLRQHLENVSKECCWFFLYTFFPFPPSLWLSLALWDWLFLLIPLPQTWKCVHIIYVYPVSGQFDMAGLLLALSLFILKGQFIWTIVFKLPQKDWVWIDICPTGWEDILVFDCFPSGLLHNILCTLGSLLLFYCIFFNSGKQSVWVWCAFFSILCDEHWPEGVSVSVGIRRYQQKD